MPIFPFVYRRYESNLSWDSISENLKDCSYVPDAKFDISKAIDPEIYEAQISNKSFVLGRGKSVLKFGISSLFPILKGNVKTKKYGLKTVIHVTIRPFIIGAIFFSFFILFLIYGIYITTLKKDYQSVVFFAIFIVILYLPVIIRFNKEYKKYLNIIERLI